MHLRLRNTGSEHKQLTLSDESMAAINQLDQCVRHISAANDGGPDWENGSEHPAAHLHERVVFLLG